MAGRFGPGRAELKLRLVVAVLGLGLTGYALWRHGIGGIASAEVAIIATAFFGGTGFFAARALWRARETDGAGRDDR